MQASEVPQPIFVAIAGNIGSGKSSLTTLLSHHFKCRAYYEIVETNPYLADFYADMRNWSFHTQIFFLTKRFQHLREILSTQESVVQDRSIYEDAEVFAKNLFVRGFMSERDFKTYVDHFELLSDYLRAPDLMIYLRSNVDVLNTRIAARNRSYETRIPQSYLQSLNETYEAWAEDYRHGPLISIDVSKLDFVNSAEDLRQILAIIKWEMDSLSNKNQFNLPFEASQRGRKTSNQSLLTITAGRAI